MPRPNQEWPNHVDVRVSLWPDGSTGYSLPFPEMAYRYRKRVGRLFYGLTFIRSLQFFIEDNPRMLRPLSFLQRAIQALRKLRRCTWAERRDLGVAFFTATVVAGLLHTVSFRRVLQIIDWGGQSPSPHSLSESAENRLLWAVEAATRRLLPERPCLTQALAAYVLLSRRGSSDARLRIGVKRRPDGSLDAHAWLERDGIVLIGGAASPSSYSMLTPRPRAGTQ
jgi:hypothetical protein